LLEQDLNYASYYAMYFIPSSPGISHYYPDMTYKPGHVCCHHYGTVIGRHH